MKGNEGRNGSRNAARKQGVKDGRKEGRKERRREGTYEKVIQIVVHIVEQTAVRTGRYPRTNCTNLYKQLYKQGQILVETVQTLRYCIGVTEFRPPVYIPRFVQFVRGNAQFVQLFVRVCTVCTMICYLA